MFTELMEYEGLVLVYETFLFLIDGLFSHNPPLSQNPCKKKEKIQLQ